MKTDTGVVWQTAAIHLASAVAAMTDARRRGEEIRDEDLDYLATVSDKERRAWAAWVASAGEGVRGVDADC